MHSFAFMKTHSAIVCCVLLFSVVALPPLCAKDPKKKQELSTEEVMKALVEAPTPDYPSAFRAQRLQGTGLFQLHFNSQTGHVDAVKVVKSTGHFELDTVAVKTFNRWRCRPGWLESATIPISFTYDRPHRGVGVHSY